MSRWIDIAKKNLEVPQNTVEPVSIETIAEIVDNSSYLTPEIQEDLDTKILDTYCRLIEVADEGLNAYLLCDERDDKSKSFFKMIYKNLDYTYYGKNDSNDNHDAESDISEDYPWENRRNRFAYT
jgi:hypothetical protein